MNCHSEYQYLKLNGESFFTAILLPEKNGRFPTVLCRSPYVSAAVDMPEEEIVQKYLLSYENWLRRGYAVIFQHCRGQGKSTGAFIPYVNEREDGLALREWIRSQSFYNGELFLLGASYSATLHYATAPFEDDIKGAVLEVQDTERYRLWYRNGQMRKGHANWHFKLYKAKCKLNKTFTMRSFSELPLKNLSERVLGERAEDFEQMLTAYSPENEFWNTRFGGCDTKGATDDTSIPILLTTGYNDFYVGGVFRMWHSMSAKAKERCALLVSPYDHGDGYSKERGLFFDCGKRSEAFGDTYRIDWFDNIRSGAPLPYKKGVITYYRAFENRWESDFYASPTEDMALTLGTDTATFIYDPLDPPSFSAEGELQEKLSARSDVISLYTTPLDKDVFIKGQMKAVLTVSSSCPDSSFYVSISIKKPQGDYVLRHDITSLSYLLGDYTENDAVTLNFCFDEHAFLLKKGESLRVDISSTDNNVYVSHTNKKGPYYLQTESDIAVNKVYLDRSQLFLPIEKQ
ncbi:MAG: CocE/NonD family hydrolase [Clostridia bacterium]|nr:CocE/NonD family hydrolase [Clostridia bacterium]